MSGAAVEDPKAGTAKKGEEEKAPKIELASIRDVFSFGQGKFWFILGGMLASMATGAVFPAMAWIFADSFQQLGGSASGDAFMQNIRQVAYTLMVLGVIAFTAMTAQAALLEYSADIMTRDLKNKWFRALLRQDMAFYDIKDVSGTATIISSSGAKFKK